MKKFLKELGSRIIWLLCPKHCPYCDELIGYHDTECPSCAAGLCGEPVTIALPDGGECIAPFRYDGKVRSAIVRFKFSHDTSAADSLAKQTVRVVEPLCTEIDAVTNVPLSDKSFIMRGYDQSEIVARKTAELLGKPYLRALRKTIQRQEQHKLSTDLRRDNVKDCYIALNPDSIKGRSFLLIDDICTSGYTISECRKVLLSAGAESVLCSAIAVARNARVSRSMNNE